MLNSIITQLPVSGSIQMMEKAQKMRTSGIEIIDLSGGEPDFPTPPPIVLEAVRQMEKGFTHYTVGKGLPRLREKISEKLFNENHIFSAPDEIIVTPGGKFAIYLAVCTLLNPKDEVIYFTPAWVSYLPIIKAAGGVGVSVTLSYDNDYNLDYQVIKEKITKRTKLIIINYPNNPTGKILNQQNANVLKQILMEFPDLYLLSDEIYEKIVFDNNKNISMGSIKEIKTRVITINGFSKSYAMTGWRLGYLQADIYIINQVYKLYQHTLTCVSGFIQKAGIVAFDCNNYVENMRVEYEKRRDFLINKLSEISTIDCKKPEGGFYLWLKVNAIKFSDIELAGNLMDEKQVVCVPGSSYGEINTSFLRISFANSMEVLETAAFRLAEYFST